MRELGIGQRHLVEIARALALDTKIHVLDEPTAALTGTEIDQLLETMADLRDQRVGLVFITHHLHECRRIADRITVLHDGRSVGVLPAGADVEQMIELMALGAIRTLGDRAGKDVQVVGFDGTPDALAAIEGGAMAATIAQQPKVFGRTAVEQAVKAAEGEQTNR